MAEYKCRQFVQYDVLVNGYEVLHAKAPVLELYSKIVNILVYKVPVHAQLN